MHMYDANIHIYEKKRFFFGSFLFMKRQAACKSKKRTTPYLQIYSNVRPPFAIFIGFVFTTHYLYAQSTERTHKR